MKLPKDSNVITIDNSGVHYHNGYLSVIHMPFTPKHVLDLIRYLIGDCMDSSERQTFLSLLPDLPAANNSTRETGSIHNPKHDPLFFSMSESWHAKLSTEQAQLLMIWQQLSRYNLNPIEYLLPHAIDGLARIMEIFMNHKETAEPQAKAAPTKIDTDDRINTPAMIDLNPRERVMLTTYYYAIDRGVDPSTWPNQKMYQFCKKTADRFGDAALRQYLNRQYLNS